MGPRKCPHKSPQPASKSTLPHPRVSVITRVSITGVSQLLSPRLHRDSRRPTERGSGVTKRNFHRDLHALRLSDDPVSCSRKRRLRRVHAALYARLFGLCPAVAKPPSYRSLGVWSAVDIGDLDLPKHAAAVAGDWREMVATAVSGGGYLSAERRGWWVRLPLGWGLGSSL